VGQYQKGKANLGFTEARDSEWQWHQLGHMQVCTSLQTDNHASTPPFFFTGRMPFLPPNQQRQGTEGKDMGLDLSGNGSSCMTRETETWLSDSRVGNNSVVDDQSSLHCVIVSTDVVPDHTERRDASRGGGCSNISAYTGQFGWASVI